MKSKSTAKAFSLVELLIVLAIFSIVITIAAPAFSKYRGNANLREVVREISGDIKLCKQNAVAENSRYRIQLNVRTNNYIIQKETSSSHWTNVSSLKNIGADDAALKISRDPTYGGDRIYFQPRGTTTAGTLEIQHEKFLSKASIVTSTMGRVRIEYELK